jgi:ABC-type glycerol-3-phosphate transport system substrate-binding protein
MKKLLLGLLIVVMLVAACGSPAAPETTAPPVAPTEAVPGETVRPGPAPTASERTTIRFAVSDFEQAMYEDMAAAFEEENPDLHVEFVSQNQVLGLGSLTDTQVPDDAAQRLVAAADVVSMGVSRNTVDQGLVRDLSPFIQADANFQPDDYYSGALSAYQWEGGTWALPTSVNYQLIFFDKDIFDQAGVPYPEVGWTWDDLLAKAQALTEGEGDQVARWGFVPNGNTYRLVESRAGSLADYNTTPPTPLYDDDKAVDAMRWITNLHLKEQVMPYFEPTDDQGTQLVSDEQALVDGGQAAMWVDVDLMWWIRSQQTNIGVVPFPAGGAGSGLTPASVSDMVMSAGTKQPEAAWRWLDYVSRQPLGVITMGIRFLSARRSVAETEGFWDALDEEFATALRYATEHSYATRETVAYSAFEDALNAIMKGEKSVEEAMADAQAQADAQIQEEITAQTGATPVPTFVVAPSEQETPVAEGAVTITFVPALGSLNLEPFRALAAQFNEAHPDIVVNVKMADFLSGTPNLPAMAKGSDCFEWYPSFQDAKNRDAILSLAPFVDADTAFSTADYLPQALNQFMWQGQLMGLPADITPYVLEYNKDLFDAAGLAYPAMDWTWDDFLQLAVDLTKGEGDTKQYGFVAEYYELNDLLLLTERLGAKLIDTNADPPALSFNDPDTIKAFRWYAGLTTEHQVKPVFVTDLNKLLASASTAMFEREGLITSGRAAMWTGSPTTAAVFGERTGINVGAAPAPRRADGTSPGALLATTGYFISAQTESRGAQNAYACWQWLAFLSTQPAAIQGLPARLSLAQSDEYRQQVGAEHADAYLASVGESERPSVLEIFDQEEWLGGAIYWYGQAFGQVIEGKASVEDALDTAQKLADDYRACVVAGGDMSQAAWQACAKQTDPTLPDFLFTSAQ